MRTSTIASLGALTLLLAAALPAAAEDAPSSAKPASSAKTVAPEFGAGVGLGIPFGGMSVGPEVFLEAGARILLGPGSLSIALRGSFETFGKDGQGKMPCTAAGGPCIGARGGAYSYHLTEQAVLLGLPITYRFLPPDSMFNPYVGVMPELFLMKARTTSFNQLDTQGEVEFGVGGILGGQLKLGPGGLFLDLVFQYAAVNAEDPTSKLSLTGKTNLGAFAMALGYRVAL